MGSAVRPVPPNPFAGIGKSLREAGGGAPTTSTNPFAAIGTQLRAQGDESQSYPVEAGAGQLPTYGRTQEGGTAGAVVMADYGPLARARAALGETASAIRSDPAGTLGHMAKSIVTAPFGSARQALLDPVQGEEITSARALRGKAGPLPGALQAGERVTATNSPGAITEREQLLGGAQSVANIAAGGLAGGKGLSAFIRTAAAGVPVGAAYDPEDPARGAIVGAATGAALHAGAKVAGAPLNAAGRIARRATDVSGGMMEAGAKGAAGQADAAAPRFTRSRPPVEDPMAAEHLAAARADRIAAGTEQRGTLAPAGQVIEPPALGLAKTRAARAAKVKASEPLIVPGEYMGGGRAAVEKAPRIVQTPEQAGAIPSTGLVGPDGQPAAPAKSGPLANARRVFDAEGKPVPEGYDAAKAAQDPMLDPMRIRRRPLGSRPALVVDEPPPPAPAPEPPASAGFDPEKTAPVSAGGTQEKLLPNGSRIPQDTPIPRKDPLTLITSEPLRSKVAAVRQRLGLDEPTPAPNEPATTTPLAASSEAAPATRASEPVPAPAPPPPAAAAPIAPVAEPNPRTQPAEYINYAKKNLDVTTRARIERMVDEGRAAGTIDKGRQSFAEQQALADDFAKKLVADPLMLDRTKLQNLSGAKVQGIWQVVQQNGKALEASARILNDEAASPAARAEAQRLFDAASTSTNEALSIVVRETSQTARDLGFHRQLARQTLDPEVWLVQAKKHLGDKPLSEGMMLEIRKLARQAATSCGAA